MRQILSRFCFILTLCLVYNLAPAAAAGKTEINGILWRIDGAPSPSYVLGTMHSDDERVTRLPQAVKAAFDASRSFVSEIRMEPEKLMHASMAMFFVDGTLLSDVVDAELYRKSVELLADYGLAEATVKKMKPWAVATTLSMPKPRSGVFLDLLLYQQAQAAGKKLYGLETVEEQIAVFDDFTPQQQQRMLADAVRQYPTMPAMMEQLLNAYVARDLDGLHCLSQSYLDEGDAEVAALFDKKLIRERNQRMLERMLPRIKEGNAFIAIGALHLPEKEGLLELLRDKGYKVSPVY